jgi:KipI family sensor histidine kinase inhibitor
MPCCSWRRWPCPKPAARSFRLLEVSDGAVLLELPNAEARALGDWLLRTRPLGFLEAVPGARTLLVLFDPATFDLSLLREQPAVQAVAARTVRLRTVYDGPDLLELSQRLGFDAARAHAQAEHVVQFLGFAPGFAYLSGGFAVPRLLTPRVRVPRGSVAVADGYTGVYPAETPGGWWLIGRIEEDLFDPFADPPSLLLPGDRVVFEPGPLEGAAKFSSEQSSRSSFGGREGVLRVVKPAGHATVQGAPRHGFAHYGVPAGGAMDLASLAAANALVGNAPLAAGIEAVLSTPALEALLPVRIATGTTIRLLQAGEILPPQRGTLRTYLAVEGGLAQKPPGAPKPPLQAGDILYKSNAAADPLPRRLPPRREPADLVQLRALPGPQQDWFEDPSQLFEAEWRLSPQSDRRGARLDGTKLRLNRPSDLPPEGTAPGAIQVPGDGRPIILGPDRPVTGGYAKIATVIWDDLPVLAQLRPGARIRFSRHSP